MSCCGGDRRHSADSVAKPTQAVFRYEGDVPITVFGPVTGTKYRFTARGVELSVDMRDRNAVRKVPRLRELRLM